MNKPAKYLLDTHVFLWLMLANQELKEKSVLETAAVAGGLLVSPITCWEIGMLTARARISLNMQCQDWIDRALKAPGVVLIDLSPRVAAEASYLPGTFHGDPADRMLVATARVKNLILATRDEKILDYSHQGHVSAIAC